MRILCSASLLHRSSADWLLKVLLNKTRCNFSLLLPHAFFIGSIQTFYYDLYFEPCEGITANYILASP